MGIVKCRNRRSGIIYVYTSDSYLDPITNKARTVRKCIGHVDPDTGETVPNLPRGTNCGPRKKSPEILARQQSAAEEKLKAEYAALSLRYNNVAEEIVSLREELDKVKQENARLNARHEQMIRAIQKIITQ